MISDEVVNGVRYAIAVAALDDLFNFGALSPVATLVLVLITLFAALPMYRRVAVESPHGDGSLSMLERLLAYWPSKVLVLSLIGFVATGFIITITLSAADATAHLIENPFLHDALQGRQVPVTLVLLVLLAAVFLKGFKEAIGVAVVLVVLYLGLSLVVIGRAAMDVVADPGLIGDWTDAMTLEYSAPFGIIGAALLVFPALALGLSGFETGVVVMPLVIAFCTSCVAITFARTMSSLDSVLPISSRLAGALFFLPLAPASVYIA